jgi:heptosyltransferase I
MPRILLVKTSSLGDVVHNFPVVSDLVSAYPGIHIDWVVEEPFAALPLLHPAVSHAIPVAVRRWRAQLHKAATWREMKAFAAGLVRERYDAIVDTQGLFKSATIARIARGRRYGLGWRASREPLFPFYHRTFDVPRALHAVERNRSLVSQALAYAPAAAVDYGVHAGAREFSWLPPGPYAVLLHATSARAKLWTEAHWISLAGDLAGRGMRSILPWGSTEERARSERLAHAMGLAVVPPRLPLQEAASLLNGARCVVGVDTGLTHLAGALGVPTIGIYVATDPARTGLYGCAHGVNVGDGLGCPDVDAVTRELSRLIE